MYNFGDAVAGLFMIGMFAVISAIALALYVILSTFLMSSDWDICSKMSTDAEKVQCMEIHNE
jgi:uncharacterized membrane protein YphA (DoxX/SURF4 family)